MAINTNAQNVIIGDSLVDYCTYQESASRYAIPGKNHMGQPMMIPIGEHILSRHMLLLGGIGTGKSNAFNHIIRNTRSNLTNEDVMIIFDTKGDFYKEFYRPGDVVISNDARATGGSEADYWNIFEEVTIDDRVEENILEIAKGLFAEKLEHTTQPFFPNAAKDLFAALMLHLVRNDKFADKRNNKSLRSYLNSITPHIMVDILNQHSDLKAMQSYIYDEKSGQTLGVAKLIKCKIKYSDGSKKVSGLKEMELFDPFKNLKVTFSGVEPNGEADIEYNGDMLSEYDFTCDKTSGLKNGDKIKISLTEDAGYYVDQYNKAPSVLEKEYKVKNLGKYLSKIKEVDTDGMNSARAKAQKSISDMVDYWSEDVTLDKVSYAGDYLQVAKDSDDYTKNYYGVIYQINAHIQPDGGQRKDVVSYYSMKFENVIVGGDGKCEIDLDEYDVPYDDFSVEVTSGDLSSGSYSFDGYQTLEELKKNYVDEVADEFDCEWDVSGKLEAVDLGVTSDYLCSYSSDRLLTDSDVEGYLNANYSEYNFPEGINIIQMIINEIYAKHGYEFTDSKLSAYFSNKTWYKSNTNKVNDMNAVSDSMSEIEKKNVDFLNSYR